MKKAKLSFLYLLTGILVQAQNEDTITLHIGDHAPALQVDSWLKGPAIDSFQRGRVYLLDFWATWCHPCVNALPHLSQLQTKYGDKLVVVGVDVYEDDKRFLAQAKHKADSISRTVSIRIAKDEKNRMVESWIHAADEANMVSLDHSLWIRRGN